MSSEDFLQAKKTGLIRENKRPITNWAEFLDFAAERTRKWSWLFRGERDYSWELQTTIERAAIDFSIGYKKLPNIEQGLLRRFKREYHRHSPASPGNSDHFGWLAIMQHHGAPTRLLDATYSIYVALYFALWRYCNGRAASLWCFNTDWLYKSYCRKVPFDYQGEWKADKDERFERLFELVLADKAPKVYMVNPFDLPERLVRQNGGFLVPVSISTSFLGNLNAMPYNRMQDGPAVIKQKLRFNKKDLAFVLKQLNSMNINRATLFPGLDGFSEGIRNYIPAGSRNYGRIDSRNSGLFKEGQNGGKTQQGSTA